MNVLELFSGSRSIGKVAERRWHKVFSSDFVDFPNTDYVCDILEFDYNKVPFTPDVLWASPPCTAFSVACIGKKWVKGEPFTPKTKDAEQGIKILEKTLDIIKHYTKLNPSLKWYLENPRGKMRKAPHWDAVDLKNIRRTISYCKYGDVRMKPTDIWTNDASWEPKPMCKNYKYDRKGNVIDKHCHHEASPRSSQQGGTQKLRGNFERSKIPPALCLEIIKSSEIKN